MNISSPKTVKDLVSTTLKQRKLTQQAVADRIGLSRQTVTAILSSEDYFSERHAVLFSLAFGFNKAFLLKGEGNLFDETSQSGRDVTNNHIKRVLRIYRMVFGIAKILNRLVLKYGVDECRPLLDKAEELYVFITMIENARTVFPEGIERPPLDDTVLAAAEKVLGVMYSELLTMISKKTGIDIEFNPDADGYGGQTIDLILNLL